MKIAYVCDNVYPYYIGGIEKRVWELTTRLAQKDHEVHIFTMKYWDGEDVFVRDDGVYLHGVCPARPLFDDNADHRSIKQALYFAQHVTLPLFKERFDLIDCQNFPYFSCFSAKMASAFKKSNLYITWHEVWGDYWNEYLGKKGFVGKNVERIVARMTNKMIAVSELTKRNLHDIGVRQRVHLIPNGIDYEFIHGISPSEKHVDIFYSGRMIKEKNVDLLIKSVYLVKESYPNVQCLIIGHGPEKEILTRLISELSLQDNIHLNNPLATYEEVIGQMKAAKILGFPTMREGFGILALEANACGLPVVTTDHPLNAAQDLIVEGENGFLSSPSVDDFAQKLLVALERSENMREKCCASSKKYNWNEIAADLEKVYMNER